MNLNVFICEPNSNDCNILKDYLIRFQFEMSVNLKVYSFSNSQELLTFYDKYPYIHILILNTKIDRNSGVDIAKHLRKRSGDNMAILFYSNTTSDIIECIDVRPVSYMIKPINYLSFKKELIKCIGSLNNYNSLKLSLLNNEEKIYSLIFLSDLVSIKTTDKKNYVSFNLRDGLTLDAKGVIKDLYNLLSPYNFCRVNKSEILNLKYVKCLDHMELHTVYGDIFYVSNSQIKTIKNRLNSTIIKTL
ncbi:MAG: LytTR family transcriptional regulator DNA-binding domain-containing protein [Lachnospiraceae bacterium]|nr:LytTR family transcriptional regulator DNA-binding domain-containing protein [Lachnospiraceae bacterium]